MSKFIDKAELDTILKSATEKNLRADEVVQSLVDKGHTIEGLNEPEKKKDFQAIENTPINFGLETGSFSSPFAPASLALRGLTGATGQEANQFRERGAGENIFGTLGNRLANIGSIAGLGATGEQSIDESIVQVAGEVTGGVGDVAGSIAKPAISAISKEATLQAPLAIGKKALENEQVQSTIQGLMESYEEIKDTNPRLARNIEASINVLSSIPISKGAKTVGDDIAKKLTPEQVIQADDAMEQALKTSNAKHILDVAQEGAEKVTFREKLAGVRPDVKKRIIGKTDKLKEYFNIANARNLSDEVPTPLEFASNKATVARDELAKTLNDTGSKIGGFRNKIQGTSIGVDDIQGIEKTFVDELEPLNLAIKNGKIVRKTGKIAGKVSDSEIRVLQELADDLKTLKSSPKIENTIDYRNAIQNKINFKREAKEVSGVVDPLARKVRAKIRDANIKTVGKEQARLLDDYSDMIGLLDEMNRFVESRSGAEFLLKRVLSERGRIPREIIAKLTDITGIDLMDDATMAQIATEIVGNQAQKSSLEQAISAGGLAVTGVFGGKFGSPATVNKLIGGAKELIAPAEEMFIKASQR